MKRSTCWVSRQVGAVLAFGVARANYVASIFTLVAAMASLVFSLSSSSVSAAVLPPGAKLVDPTAPPPQGKALQFDNYGRIRSVYLCVQFEQLPPGHDTICNYASVFPLNPPSVSPPGPAVRWLCIPGVNVLPYSVPFNQGGCAWLFSGTATAFQPSQAEIETAQRSLSADLAYVCRYSLGNVVGWQCPSAGEIASQYVQNPRQPEEIMSGCQFGDPCEAFSGNYFHEETDLTVAGLLPIRIIRAYYSGKNGFVGAFGVGSHLVRYSYRWLLPRDASGHAILVPRTSAWLDTGNGTLLPFTNGETGGPVFKNGAKLGTAGNRLTLQMNDAGLVTGAAYLSLQQEKLIFDANGYLVHAEDRHGNGQDLLRDTKGRLQSISELSTGRQLTIAYNGDGLISDISDPAGRKVSYGYSPAKELLTVTRVDGKSMSYGWDVDHRIVARTDWKGGLRMTNEYGSTGAVRKQTLAGAGVYVLEAPSELVRKVTDPNGHVATHRYNSEGLITEAIDALGNITRTRYARNLFSESAVGRFIVTTDPLGRTGRTDLNGDNLPTLLTDALGQKTRVAYDLDHPDKPKAMTDPKGHTTSFRYDPTGNLLEVMDNAGHNSRFTYNGRGQVLTASNPLGHTTRFAYNARHELIRITDPLGHASGFLYDDLGRVIRVIDARKHVTRLAYDQLDRLTSSTNALGQIRRYGYDANGNLIRATNARGFVTRNTYDAKDRLIRAINPKGEVVTYAYDAADQLVSVTDAKAQRTDYTYDAADRLIELHFADGTDYRYTFDAAGQLLKISDGTNQWQYAYDRLGRLTGADTPQGQLSYEYDANSNRVRMASPGYGVVTYGYDAIDRLTRISKDGNAYGYAYDAASRRIGLTRPNGVRSTYQYDRAGHLTGLVHRKGSAVLETHHYRYDANGNIVQYVKGGGPYGALTRAYGYDALDRLALVNAVGILTGSRFASPADGETAQQYLAQVGDLTKVTASDRALIRQAVALGARLPESARWAFDENGNIIRKAIQNLGTGAVNTRTMTYDEADRLVSMVKSNVTITYTYDENGNLTGDSTGRRLTWNALDHLTRLEAKGLVSQYRHDPQGRRTSFDRNGTPRAYLYDGLDMLGDGHSTFLHGAGIDEVLQLDSDAKSLGYLQDHLGSSSQLIDALSGAEHTRYDFKSYGNLEQNRPNPESANPFTYTGREDDGTGLYYYRARYYDPEIERFISRDPIGFGSGDINFYAYVNDNPLSLVDPLGNKGERVTKGNDELILKLNEAIRSGDTKTVQEVTKEIKYTLNKADTKPERKAALRAALKTLKRIDTFGNSRGLRQGFTLRSQIGGSTGFFAAGLLSDLELFFRACASGRTFDQQSREELKGSTFVCTVLGCYPVNPTTGEIVIPGTPAAFEGGWM